MNLLYFFRKQDRFRTNRDAANYLKKYLDKRYPWLEWIVIAYNNKNKNEQDTRAAYYDLKTGWDAAGLKTRWSLAGNVAGLISRGMINFKTFSAILLQIIVYIWPDLIQYHYDFQVLKTKERSTCQAAL